ncbi:putative GTPase HflX [Citrobacter amalonaticus]|nr:putative GTPase HflX [Citrobacter amalonaticus]
MFDRYDAGEQAVLVHIYFSQDKDMEDLQEFESLVSSAGVEAMQVITGSRKAPHPKYFVGEGKAVEIAEAVKATGAAVVLFDHALSPAQERNLERLCECRVIDRTGLILDIFAQRARTHEGKLQVELAQLRHLATRLVRGWTTLKDRKAGLVCAVRVKPNSKPTAVYCETVYCRSSRAWKKLKSNVSRGDSRALRRMSRPSRWWDILTPENPPFSIR